jgi:PAS domain S-box-containing protein/putative nucleotidyltransferase with HDIG domain
MGAGILSIRIHRGTHVITENNMGSILVVDDEMEVMETLCEMLELHGYRTAGFTNGPDALRELKTREYDLLITDLVMPGMDGITFLNACLEIDPDLVGIVMTGQGSVKTAVAAMKTGAFDYILKPFKLNTILAVLIRAMSVRRLKSENIELKGAVAMYELTRALSVTTDLAVIADKVADAAMEECRADEVSVLLPTGKNGELYIAAVRGAGRNFLAGERIETGEGIAGWVAVRHETVALEGEVKDVRFQPLHPRADIKAALSIPMMAGGKFVGVMNVSTTRRRSFAPGQMKALTIMAGIAAPSLENALLFKQLSEAEKNYRNIFENAVEGIFQATIDGRFLTANPALANMLGYSSSADLLSSVTDIRRRIYVDASKYDESRRRLEEGEELRGFETQVYRRDGSIIWVSMSARRIKDLSGRTACYECAVEDITERKHAEESLRESEERYRIAIEHSNDGIAIVRGDEHIYVNRKFVEMFGYDRPDELVGKPVAMVVDPDDREALTRINLGRREGLPGPGKYEFKGLRKNGESIYVEVSAANTLYHGQIVSLAYFRDVTYRRKAEEELRTSYEQVRKTMGSAIQAMSVTVEMRDPYTSGHQKRVSLLARGIAEEMGMTDQEIEGIRVAGIIHDIGKISVPAEILSKPARLSDIEFDLIKCHSQSGFDILKELEFPWPLAEIVLQHHERLDGSGYPKHLKNGTILPQARIIAVADVVEAIASHRPYRPALGVEVALSEIDEKKDILYDADVADTCLKLFKERGFTFSE